MKMKTEIDETTEYQDVQMFCELWPRCYPSGGHQKS